MGKWKTAAPKIRIVGGFRPVRGEILLQNQCLKNGFALPPGLGIPAIRAYFLGAFVAGAFAVAVAGWLSI